MSIIKLSEIKKFRKFQLADIAGYKIKEVDSCGRCAIVGADNCINNDFRNIDEVLLLISNDLKSKGFLIVA